MSATHQREFEELAFRVYVTESLRLRGENKFIKKSWTDMIEPHEDEQREPEEIVSDVISRAGLVLNNEPT